MRTCEKFIGNRSFGITQMIAVDQRRKSTHLAVTDTVGVSDGVAERVPVGVDEADAVSVAMALCVDVLLSVDVTDPVAVIDRVGVGVTVTVSVVLLVGVTLRRTQA